ncbi:molybdopterin-dependent oxidoreductase [Rathayibacter soli]|uniref:molybdopterin-dependent oxidoreductase n=1 Tax=Rathayibacter soli TaxID=3144168 RepID=UPI0027E49C8A|nr:molybdopterin-dependent oxidoreductase [Glaciibacter superstes]
MSTTTSPQHPGAEGDRDAPDNDTAPGDSTGGTPAGGTGATPKRALSPGSWFWIAAACGVLSGLATQVAAVGAALISGQSSTPFFAVGAWVVDLTPAWFREWIISVFGSSDKPFLFVCLGVLLFVLAVAVGALEFLRPPFGVLLLAAIGVVAVLAVLTRPDASVLSAAPTVVGFIVGVIVLQQSILRMRRWHDAAAELRRVPNAEPQLARRSFLRFVGLSAAAAVAVGVGVQLLSAGTAAVTSIRNTLKLPRAAFAAAPIPAGADLKLPGLSPYITPVGGFYRVDTALQVPAVDPNNWKLRIDGMVENPVDLTFAQLLALPLTEHTATLTCVSNEVGGNLAGNATWLGYPLRELLARAVPKAGADMVLSTSADGWTAGTPLSALTDNKRDALLAVGMNGAPLPLEHGFPVRMVVPGLYGYVSATKWVVQLNVTQYSKAIGYWTDKGWSAMGPVKLASRIDTPTDNSTVHAGRAAIAGVAWDQHVGIARVEVRVDNGPWQQARLADAVSADTWRQWVLEWDATAGNHTVQVRATNASGEVQTSAQAPPAPNGATGWHTIGVSVS